MTLCELVEALGQCDVQLVSILVLNHCFHAITNVHVTQQLERYLHRGEW